MTEKIIEKLFRYSPIVISQTTNTLRLDISDVFSDNEEIVFSFNQDKIIFIHALCSYTEIRNRIFEKHIPINEGDDEDFILEDIISSVETYLLSQEDEFEYAINKEPAQRVTILKQISKIKRTVISDLEKELELYNDVISPIMIEETKRKGFDLKQVIMLKNEAKSIDVKHNKKYYIKEMVPIFPKNYSRKDFNEFKPFIHFVVGRIKTDGFTFNPNIIGEDNYCNSNRDDDFLKTIVVKKDRFAEKYPNISSNVTTFILNKPDEFPELDDGTIYKHSSITYGNSFFNNFVNKYRFQLEPEFNDVEYTIKDYLIEFGVNGKQYMYILLDDDKNFVVGKKSLSKLLKMVENRNPNVVPLPENYIKTSLCLFTEKQIDTHKGNSLFSDFLFPYFKRVISEKK